MALIATLGACERGPEATAAAPPTEVTVDSNCGDNGVLTAQLYGSIERALDWSAADMRCESMQRPDGEGVRLRFTGDAAERRLSIILALPGLEPGVTGAEYPTVATLTVEGTGRFFSTPNLDACWSDIAANDRLDDDDQRYAVTGTLYCVAPLGEVNGDAAIEIAQLGFRSIVDWGEQ